MAEQSFWQRAVAAVHREYDRRIRRASLVTEYGAGHHADHHKDHSAPPPDDEAAEIVNVPKGTPVARHAHPPETGSPS